MHQPQRDYLKKMKLFRRQNNTTVCARQLFAKERKNVVFMPRQFDDKRFVFGHRVESTLNIFIRKIGILLNMLHNV